MWFWLKENKPLWVGLIGAVLLILYGVVATMQPANFGRVYAAYGGVFIVMAVFCGWKVDKVSPINMLSSVLQLRSSACLYYFLLQENKHHQFQ